MSESPYPEGMPDFVIETLDDCFLTSEIKMADPKVDANYARGYFMACVDMRESLRSSKMTADERREKRRLEAAAALQQESSGKPS